MKKQAKTQDALPIEAGRHPMWTPPQHHGLPLHIYVLRREIARVLTPFDGRPNSELIIEFCRQVYDTSALEAAQEDAFWAIGQIVVLGLGAEQRIERRIHPDHATAQRAAIGVVQRLVRELTAEVARTCI